VIGDDDTLFSPLALAQWVGNFDSADPWYGNRIEKKLLTIHSGSYLSNFRRDKVH
jgi:hypothetical protein